MSIEHTCLELYRQHAQAIAAGACSLLNAQREEAFQRLSRTGIPDTGAEDYRHFDLQEVLSVDYGLNIHRYTTPLNPKDVFRCDVPNLSTKLYFIVNDLFTPSTVTSGLPDGVYCGGLREMAENNPGLLEPYYAKLSAEFSDGMADLNSLMVQDGFVVYLPKGTCLDKPIQLIQVHHGSQDLMANRRLLIIAEEGSAAQILVCDHALSSGKFLSNQVTEVFLHENASVELYELEMGHSDTVRVSNTYVQQEASSRFLMNGMVLQNGRTRNNIHVRLAGPQAEANVSGMALGDQDHVIDNHLFIEHQAPHCTSSELFKYVLDDASQGVFGGRILVCKGAQKTSAYQSNKNLCATKTARMFAKPQLEIYADDVKCSHGSATGQINENALFYMRARGISEREARLLLKFAFTADVLDNIRLEPLKDRMRLLTEKRFRGELAKCSGCGAASKS
jgi:Fe-S cluster assembly protein SufD